MQQYLDACRKVLSGTRKVSRTGIDTISKFNVGMEFDLRSGFPLCTTKRMPWFAVLAELLFFISGERNAAFLQRHGVKIWDEWLDEEGNMPEVSYGEAWRRFPIHKTKRIYSGNGEFSHTQQHIGFNDQLAWVVDTLRKDPMSRRVVMSAWAPGAAQVSRIPPCHVLSVFNVQELLPPIKADAPVVWDPDEPIQQSWHPQRAQSPGRSSPHLCLHLTQRSCDMFLGVPFNVASYALLLSIVAKLVGLPAGIFAHTLVDAHIYTRPADWKPGGLISRGGTHGESADLALDHVPQIREQLTRQPRLLPRLTIDPGVQELSDFTAFLNWEKEHLLDVFRLDGYDPHPAIKGSVAV